MAQTNPLRYRSYYYDSETGYYHLKSRYYSPEVGRWISPEPNVDYGEFDEGSEILGYNVYAYCFNNPVNNFDPKATAVLIGIGIGALIGGGAVGGRTTEVLKDVGSNVLGKVGKKLVEDGVDMALDLTQTATENGGLTGKDVLFSAVTSFGGDLVGAAKTNSTARNQLIDGATDNRAIKDAVGDSVSDASKNTTKYIDAPYGKAFQENSEEALRVKKYVEDGGDLYRGGSFGRSNTTDAQFWAPESPLFPRYADKYGVDFKDTDYVIKGKLDPNADFITRSAPGLGNNSGGAIEIVTNPNGVKLDSFNMIGE